MYHDHIPQENKKINTNKTPQIKALLIKFCNVSFSLSVENVIKFKVKFLDVEQNRHLNK